MKKQHLTTVEIARLFIGWRVRLRGKFVSIPAESRAHPGTRSFSDFKHGIGESLASFDNQIISKAYPNLGDDDRENAIVSFFQKYYDFAGWHRAMLDDIPLDFEFHCGCPSVDLDTLPLLRQVESDADALAMLAFVRQAKWWQAAELDTWGEQVVCSDRGLNCLLKKGTVENHVHMEGCYSVPHTWMLLLFGEKRLNEIDRYSIAAQTISSIASGVQEGALTGIQAEVFDIQRGITSWNHLVKKFIRLRHAESTVPTSHAVHSLRYPDFNAAAQDSRTLPFTKQRRDALALERCVLAWAWWHALNPTVTEEAQDEDEDEDKGKDNIIVKHLDKYLFAKNLFLKAIIQFPGTPPGLARFKKHFKLHKVTARYTPTRSVRMLTYVTLLENIADNPHLDKLEFRISPFNNVRGYIDFFQAWNGISHEFQKYDALKDRASKGDLRFVEHLSKLYRNTRFIIHFIREPKGIKDSPPFHDLRRMLGVQSAILHHFRVRFPELAKLIVAVDVANLERECSPEIFSPFLRLVREPHLAQQQEETAEDEIGFNGTNPDYTDKWRRLALSGSYLTPSLPKLGLTYHAGEDFFNPIDGMRQMDGAIRYGGMVAGDRIGHGLAAGISLDDFFSSALSHSSMPQGAILDSLVWLFHRAGGQSSQTESRLLEDFKNELSRGIYGCRLDWRTLQELAALRFKLPPSFGKYREYSGKKPTLNSSAEEILWLECFNQEIVNQRKAWTSQKKYFSKLEMTCRIAQQAFLQEIHEKRIIVEFNPSSNMSILHLNCLSQHPYWEYRKLLGKAPDVTINTDDPGVFNTRQDIEYGLIFHSMLKQGLPIETALEELEQIRIRGYTSHFG